MRSINRRADKNRYRYSIDLSCDDIIDTEKATTIQKEYIYPMLIQLSSLLRDTIFIEQESLTKIKDGMKE